MAYRFKQKVESLKSGRSYAIGSIVPDGLIAPDYLDTMIASGDIEKTGLIVEPEIIEEIIGTELEIIEEVVETEVPVQPKQLEKRSKDGKASLRQKEK